MQDLGTIHIDIDGGEGAPIPAGRPGGGTPGTASRLTEMAGSAQNAIKTIMSGPSGWSASIKSATSTMGSSFGTVGKIIGVASAALSVMSTAVMAVVGATIAAYNALRKLHSFVMEFANELRDYSPAILAAEAQNEVEMMLVKLRMGTSYGPAIASQIRQAGRIERAVLQIQGFAASIGARFLAPITEKVADLLEAIISNRNSIFAFVNSAIQRIADIMRAAAGVFMFIPGTQIQAVLMQKIAELLGGISIDIDGIERNTRKDADFSEANQMFLNDLRLMGARI